MRKEKRHILRSCFAALGLFLLFASAKAQDINATAVLDKKERVVTFRVATDEPVFGLVDLMGEWGEMTAREEDPS